MTTLIPLDGWALIGLSGAIVYCLSYALTAADLLPSTGAYYYMMKLVGSAMMLTSLFGEFNLVILVLQGFYFLVSIIGIAMHAPRNASGHEAHEAHQSPF